jgi:hypothetical protein
MRMETFDEDRLLKQVGIIKTDKEVAVTERLSMSEYQIGTMSFTGTILDDLNKIGNYRATTLGQLANKTGVPVANLYGVICQQPDTTETAETAATASRRLAETIESLGQPAAA